MRAAPLLSVALLSSVAAAGCAGPDAPRRALAPAEVDGAPESPGLEGDAHGFPVLRDLAGAKLADGEFTQWLAGERLHVRLRFDDGAGRVIEERAVLRQTPELVQERWSWTEHRDGELQRRFVAELTTGAASAEKRVEDELRAWSDVVAVEPGRTFAGLGWTLAIDSVRARLLSGETIAFQTVGFLPEPRAATVELSYAGPERVPMSGRDIAADRFRVHPSLPWLARLVVAVPDSSIWLTRAPPAAFLRWEGPLGEPGDPLVRVDLLPGEPSGAATPEGGP